ncbi:replication-associated recombination protein A [Candidatus Falkowbacteria bacterium]|nr:replication-associated recombination protein A [Candidatus Falkowbacteria bacterium]
MKDMTPLAAQMRPQKISDFVGQNKIIASDTWLMRAISEDRVPSLVFWGPPGSGKTTLAFIIARETKADFIELSATSSGIKDLKQVVERAEQNRRLGQKTCLFVDEIHRWNKTQQDALLPHVETGTLILIGATTENPSFAIGGALLSRVKVVLLEALSEEALILIIKRATKNLGISLKKEVINIIANLANGDARRALGLLESAYLYNKDISVKLVKEIANKPQLLYDKKGEEHYNLISALHKSMRGGSADAALYYLARMLEAGEDPLYIARRLIRFASEDVGLANNSAILLASTTYDACHKIGMPEAAVNLAHCVIYLAKSAKSIAAYQAYQKARAEVLKSGNLSIPLHLRNSPTKLMSDLGYGKDYKYTPLEDDKNQEYLPEKIKHLKFF